MAAKSRPYPFNHLAAVRHLRACDPKMAELIARAGRFRMPLRPHPHPFASLLRSIVYQQLAGAAAAAIMKRIEDQLGGGAVPTPQAILAASDPQLRAVGLSRQKIAALRDLAARAADGTVCGWDELHRLDDEAIVQRLTAVRGVGVWTVHMLLMFSMGRPDVLPTLDYGVQQGYKIAYRKRQLPKPRDLARAGERWKPYRSVASWYLWEAVHLERQRTRGGSARVGPAV